MRAVFKQVSSLGRRCRVARRQQAGYSLLELLVAFVIMIEVMVGVLVLFDSSTRFARIQTNLAGMQQSQRVSQNEMVRVLRMAGVGGLPATIDNEPPQATRPDNMPGFMPNGLALAVDFTKAASDTMPNGDPIVEGSDVLILRGVFSTPVYYLADSRDQARDIASWFTPTTMTTSGGQAHAMNDNTLTIANMIHGDLPQDLQPLIDKVNEATGAGRPEALILRDTLNPQAYAVVELTGNGTNTVLAGCGTGQQCITLGVRLTNGTHFNEYARLTQGTGLRPDSGGISVDLSGDGSVVVDLPNRIGSVGLLEEYRFYLRADTVDWPDETGTGTIQRLAPTLVRARFLPGTNVLVEQVEVAANVWDLQVALGFDTNSDGVVTEDGSNTDEVLFNNEDDTDGRDVEAAPGTGSWSRDAVELHFVRITTLVGVEDFERATDGKTVGTIEDSDRSSLFNDYPYNNFRRRLLSTVVDLRNLS